MTLDGDSALSDGRSPLATSPWSSRGRLHPEPASTTRTEFQRDRDRIVHSTAFRRLAHKTQVFVNDGGDHFRTRLTHTIEVAQIARTVARALKLDEDLTEAIALGHDLGHTPFGHTGEDALSECISEFGGFDHNNHGFRVVTLLERRYAEFDGLNLTLDTLEGLVKHNGPLLDGSGQILPGCRLSEDVRACDALKSLKLWSSACLEAQVAASADDIAYVAHDVDDGVRAGLFQVSELTRLSFVAEVIFTIRSRYPGLEDARTIHELVRRLIDRFVGDLVRESKRLFNVNQIRGSAEVEAFRGPLIALSSDAASDVAAIKAFLIERMYRHPDVLKIRQSAERIVRRLFEAFQARPSLLPTGWSARIETGGLERTIADYVAGMTDRYAVNEYRRIFDETPSLR